MMNSYWAERAAALRDELNRTRKDLINQRYAYQHMRLLAMGGWATAILIGVLGGLK